MDIVITTMDNNKNLIDVRPHKKLNFLLDCDFCLENETDITLIGSHYNGKNNLYFLFISRTSLNLFMICFDLDKSKWSSKTIGKLPVTSQYYQATVQTCNFAGSEKENIVWFILMDSPPGKLFKLTINANNQNLAEYRYDGHYTDTTLAIIDNTPCTLGGGPSQKLFTYDKDPCKENYLLCQRKSPFVFYLMGCIYVIGGCNSDKTNLVEFHTLPNFTSAPADFNAYTRDWSESRLLHHSNRSIFDNDEEIPSFNTKSDSACVIGTNINLFKIDSFINNYFYSYNVLTNAWQFIKLANNIDQDIINANKTTCLGLSNKEEKTCIPLSAKKEKEEVCFKAVNI